MNEALYEFSSNIRTLGFSGTILIAKDWKIEFLESYGFASIELEVENKNDTVYRIASVTKQFTAAAILKLAEEGLLSVSDTLDMFLPDFPNGNLISIHHLLSNTSGVAGFHLGDDFFEALHSDNIIDGLISMFKDLPLAFEPGSSYDYSNSGYLLLGKIIEIVSGSTYQDYLDKTFFVPLSMKTTMCEDPDKVVKGRASFYDLRDGEVIQAMPLDMRIAGAGGILLSNAMDLHKWNQALYSGEVIDKFGFEAMTHPQCKIVDNTDYGYGLFLEKETEDGTERKKYYHTGGGPGVRSINSIYPDDRVEIIILSNLNDRDVFNNVEAETERIALALYQAKN